MTSLSQKLKKILVTWPCNGILSCTHIDGSAVSAMCFQRIVCSLKQFYKRVSSEFNQRESLKLSEMLQESALLHGPTPPPSAAAALPTSGVPESVGPSEVPISQAALELASSDTPGDPPLPHSSAPTPPHSPQAQVAGPSPNPAAKKKARQQQ